MAEQWDKILSLAQKNDGAGIKAILNAGCPITHGNRVGQTAFHIACLWGNTEAMEALLSFNPPESVLNGQNKISGATPLHCGANSNKPLEGRVECCKLLVAAGANPEEKDSYGQSAYEYANDDKLRKVLGGRVLSLHKRLEEGTFDNVLEEGEEAQLNDADPEGHTVYHLAAKMKPLSASVDAMNLFMEKTADTLLSETCNDGKTLLHYFVETHGEDCSTDTGRYSAFDSFLKAALSKQPNLKSKKLDLGAREFVDGLTGEAPPELGDTALAKAFKSRDYELAKVLISNGCRGGPGEDGRNCLDTVFDSKPVNFEMAALALQSGESVDGNISKKSNGLLHKAAQRGFLDQIVFLLENGADPNLRGRQDMTPVHLAARGCKLDALKALIEGGGEWKLQAGGKSAKDMAESQGDRGADVLELLMAME